MSDLLLHSETSNSLKQTLGIAEQIGRHIRGGEVIVLVSDLGGGKTSFVRGLARSMGSTDHVSSPSFTLTNQYRAGQLTLYHFDFYRLDEPGIMRDELAEILTDPTAVVAVEWANIVEDVLPHQHLTITLANVGDTKRKLTFTYPKQLEYLFAEKG